MVRLRDIPNLITVFRFLLVPPIVWLLLENRFGEALVLFGIAGFSDALDGFLAKRYGWTSELGGRMDPLADKLLLLASFITLGWLQLLPLWLVVLVILRDLVIVTGAIVYYFCIERIDAEPSLVSKLNTFAQILLVLAVIFSQGIQALSPGLMDLLFYSVMITTLWSGADYVWKWGRRAWSKRS